MPVILDTVRKLVAVHGSTTIAEVASFAGVPRARALEVIHRNKALLRWERRKRGPARIVGDECRSRLRQQWFKEGRYWIEQPGNYGAVTELRFEQPDLYERLAEKKWYGGLGDSHQVEVVVKSEANESALREAGLVPASEVEADDRLWQGDVEP